MMGREERHDPAVIHSSIALLQERFRQLQRVKEMREERELLRLLSEPKKLNSNTCMLYEPAVARYFFHPELMVTMLPTRMPPQTSLSLWPTSQSQGKHADQYYRGCMGVGIPPLMNLWPAAAADTPNISDSTSSLNKQDDDSDSDSDIDTSLHL